MGVDLRDLWAVAFGAACTALVGCAMVADEAASPPDRDASTPPVSSVSPSPSPSSADGAAGCVVTIATQLPGTYPCVVVRDRDGRDEKVALAARDRDADVMLLIECKAPSTFPTGEHHVSLDGRTGCTATVRQGNSAGTERYFTTLAGSVVDVTVDAIDATTAHGHAGGLIIETIIPSGKVGPTLQFTAVF